MMQHLGHPWACAFGLPWDKVAIALLRTLMLAPANTSPAGPQDEPPSPLSSLRPLLERCSAWRQGALEAWARRVRRTSTLLLDHVVWYGIHDLQLRLRRDLGLPPDGWAHSGHCLYR